MTKHNGCNIFSFHRGSRTFNDALEVPSGLSVVMAG
jgi:hypothetical protein